MNQLKRLLAMLLVLVMVLGVLPVQTFAEEATDLPAETPAAETPEVEPIPAETEETEEPALEVTPADVQTTNALEMSWRNPLYEDLNIPAYVDDGSAPIMPRATQSPTQAINTLKNNMIARKSPVVVETYFANDTSMTEEEFDAYLQYIWQYVLLSAMLHDGTPDGGDYLFWHLLNATGQIAYDDSNASRLYVQLTYELVYATTASQEEAVSAKVDEVMASIITTDMTDYEKVKAIYDYIISIVTYDDAAVEDYSDILAHTAYGALMEGSAVCDGYSVLFYRMCLEAGIDTLLITGVADGNNDGVLEEPHAWNVVCIDGYYYNVDATWDDTYAEAGLDYAYFLKCNDTFETDHARDDAYTDTNYNEDLPMATWDFPEGCIGYGKCGDKLIWKLTADGTLTITGTGLMYDNDASLAGIAKRVKTIVIENGATSIGAEAFKDYAQLESITIPKSVTSIGDYAFYNCVKLPEVVFTTDSLLKSIGNNAFYNCESLVSMSIPAKVTSLGENAFYSCDNLETITFPYSLTTIGKYAFCYCTKLTNVTLPSKLTYLYDGTFANCTSLTEIDIPSYVERIGNNAFINCTALETVTVGNSVYWILDKAFYGCTSLKNVTLGSGLLTIHDYAFYGCTALESIEFPTALRYIEQHAFENCTALKAVNLPRNLGYVNQYAFAGCTSLESVTLPSGMASIYDYAFAGATALKSITLPGNLSRFGDYIFDGCTALETVVFSGNVPVYMDDSTNPFNGVVATVYYPAGNTTWTEDNMLDYGGTLTWVSVCSGSHRLTKTVVPPTCTEEGYTSHDCSRCDYSVRDTFVPATGHAYEAVVTAPTCEDAGYTTHSCSACGDSYTDTPVDALGHSYEAVVTDPTCEDAGYTTHTCSVCGDTYTDTPMDALGHSYEAVVTPPTCTEAGFTTYTCGNCGDTYKADPMEATGHDLTEWTQEGTITLRTCQTDGCGYVEYESGAKNLTTGVLYGDITVALAEANSGDTVVLLADNDASGKTLVVKAGVTLDLESFTLKAGYLIGLNGSMVTGDAINSSGTAGGKLMVPQNGIALSASAADGTNAGYKIIPVWNGDHFIFSQAAILKQAFTVTDGTARVDFAPNFTAYVKNNLFKTDGCEDNDVSVIISVSWMANGIKVTQEYFYTTSLIIDAMNNRMLFAETTNCDQKDDLVFTISIVTDCGVRIDSQDYIYDDYK